MNWDLTAAKALIAAETEMGRRCSCDRFDSQEVGDKVVSILFYSFIENKRPQDERSFVRHRVNVYVDGTLQAGVEI